MTSATLTGIGSMSSLLHPSSSSGGYPVHGELGDACSLSPGSPTYCTLTPAGQIPIYAALQAANDCPAGPYPIPAHQMQYFSQSSMQEALHNLHKATGDVTAARGRSHSLESTAPDLTHPGASGLLASSSYTGSSHGGEDPEEGKESPEDVGYHENVSQWLNQQCGGLVKRKRKVSRNQRVAANHRERKRMGTFNQAFEKLRDTIHCQVPGNRRRKMSRIQTLKSAIQYISDLTQLLSEADNADMPPPADQEQNHAATTKVEQHCW